MKLYSSQMVLNIRIEYCHDKTEEHENRDWDPVVAIIYHIVREDLLKAVSSISVDFDGELGREINMGKPVYIKS